MARGYLKGLDRLWKQVAAGDIHTDITSCQVKDLQETVLRRCRIHHSFLQQEIKAIS